MIQAVAGFLRRSLRPLVAVAAAVLFLGAPAPPAHADLKALETEFKAAIERVEGATVVVVPSGGDDDRAGQGISGVIVSKRGLVLTHSDAGRVVSRERGKISVRTSDDVDVRVPDLKKSTFTNYKARVVARMPEISSALVQVADPPKAGFASYLVPATSAELRLGSFTFAMGNSFGFATESPPSLTAGVVAALVRRSAAAAPAGGTTDRRAEQGPYELIYTTAAINPGVSGGPLVDVRGRLVGVIVGWVDAGAEPTSPYQFLGRAMPMDRVRAFYADTPEAKDAFAATPPKALAADEAGAIELVVARAAETARASVVSLEVQRKVPLSSTAISREGKPVELARFRGPVSAVVVSADGLVVTALYDVTNLATLVRPELAALLPPAATTKAGLEAIEGAWVHLPDGTDAPAKLVAIHEGLGVALFRAELPEGTCLRVLEKSPADELTEGRFVVALGNPYGKAVDPDPLLTFGILSKRHADDADEAWRGHWQTDARGTDGNCGGAVVDLRGRLIGMMSLWDPASHGRASGIAFVLPWDRLAAALPDLAAGRSFRRPFLGVQWDRTALGGARIEKVVEGTAAQAAGLRPGDEIIEIDGKAVKTIGECGSALSKRWSGETLRLKIRRGAEIVDLTATLGTRD